MAFLTLAPLALLLASATGAESGAAGQDTSSETNAAATESSGKDESVSEEKKEKIRCRYERPVGSRISKKVCFSVREWELRQQMQEDEMRSGRNRNSGEND